MWKPKTNENGDPHGNDDVTTSNDRSDEKVAFSMGLGVKTHTCFQKSPFIDKNDREWIQVDGMHENGDFPKDQRAQEVRGGGGVGGVSSSD